MEQLNRIAEQFLKDLAKGITAYSDEKVFVEPIAVGGYVALKQDAIPHYFAGFKPSGRPVFTYDLRLAKSFPATSVNLHETVGRLGMVGVSVKPHQTVWHEGRHISEQ